MGSHRPVRHIDAGVHPPVTGNIGGTPLRGFRPTGSSPHFSPRIVARGCQGAWLQGARRSERGGVADTTLSTRAKRNGGDAHPGGSAVDEW